MKKLQLLLIATLTIGFMSCGDDAEPATLSVETQVSVNGDAFLANNIYEINGTAVSFSNVKYYMGGFKAESSLGSKSVGNDEYVLAEEGKTTAPNLITFDESGTLNTFFFFVGVAPDVNLLDEATFLGRAEEDPLSAQAVSMHWSWSTGYKFLRIDGMSDLDGDGVPETPIVYHLGNEDMRTGITYSAERAMNEGNNTLLFDLDLALLFDGVDLKTDLDTHTNNNLPLAETIRGNLSSALRLARN